MLEAAGRLRPNPPKPEPVAEAAMEAVDAAAVVAGAVVIPRERVGATAATVARGVPAVRLPPALNPPRAAVVLGAGAELTAAPPNPVKAGGAAAREGAGETMVHSAPPWAADCAAAVCVAPRAAAADWSMSPGPGGELSRQLGPG